MTAKPNALVLLSGGLDSATCLAVAVSEGFECVALSFDYGQRHQNELDCAAKISSAMGIKRHIVMPMNLSLWGGSALTDGNMEVPDAADCRGGIPVTYVPARNLVFLSLAVACAEALGARDIFIGVNSVDYSGYPDCRPAFIEAFCQCAKLGTRAADENWRFDIHTPLQNLRKAEIIRLGMRLGVDYSLTASCYNPDARGHACGVCPSCELRKNGFRDAGVPDPTIYHSR